MKRRRVTEEEKQLIFEGWQDRKPIKKLQLNLADVMAQFIPN